MLGLGLTLVRGLLLSLWSPPACEVCPCLSSLAHHKCATLAGETFGSYEPFSAHINAYLHMKPCQQRQRLISPPFVCSHVIRVVPSGTGVQLSDGLSKHSYCVQERDTCRRFGVGGLPLTVTTVRMISGGAWGRGRHQGNNVPGAVGTVRVDSTVTQRPLPSHHHCADTRRKPHSLRRSLFAGDGSAASLTATVSQRSTSEKLQSRPHDALRVCSAGASKQGTKVGGQHCAPICFTDMLLRQLRQDIPSSSDALKVAFPKRYDRISFRERVLSKLRQKDIYEALGVTHDSAQREEIMLLDACSKPSSRVSQIPLDEAVVPDAEEERKRDATEVAERGDGKENHYNHSPPSSRNRPLVPRSYDSACRHGYIPTGGCSITPENNFVNFPYSASGFKGIGAALSHPDSTSEDVNKAMNSNWALKGFHRVARESCASVRRAARGKAHSVAEAGKPRRGRRTASENLRGELGLHHRSDIFVQHISDLRRRVRISRPL